MPFRLTAPVVLSFGEEDFFLDRDIAWLRQYPNRDIVHLDGSDVDDGQVVSACETFSVDFDNPSSTKPRLVIVDNANKLKVDKRLKAYLDSRKKGDLSSVLAAVIHSEKLPAAWSKIDKSSVLVREHKKLKTWDNNNEVVKWANEEATRIKLRIEPKVALALFQFTGGDLYRIANELQKLSLLVGPGKLADLTHVQMVASRTAGSDPWEVVDAALVKDRKRAMNSLNSLYRFASEDPSILLVGTLAKGVEKAFVARSLLDRGCQADDVAARLGMHPFRYSKTVQIQAGKHTTKSLAGMMQKLSKLDVEVKSTSHRRTLIELAVLDLST